ncbi:MULTISPECIES: T9SS type A sorting domain-containing protein [Flavobacterium]|uniref:Secretion system C-terminal sorting domain-containing protein n=1 Tax=Flavobacterium hankyongi TaxID=1176532 RepID=A0ABP8ZZX4_9FLAO|nr:T9SS type A sorting domain-containing protein [Flavobacterium sp. N1846]
MNKKITSKIYVLGALFCFFAGNAQLINRALVVPEFGNNTIKTYFPTTTSTIAVNPAYTINLNSLPNGLATTASPNCTVMYGNDLFVTLTSANQRIYRFPGYGNNPANAIANVSQITNIGNDYVGITADASGNIYTSEGSYLDTHIVKYTAASNYATRIDLGNGGSLSYFANFVLDGSGNLWATDYRNNRVIGIKSTDLNTTNTTFHSFMTNSTSWSANGGHVENTIASLQNLAVSSAFAQPEGIAIDSTGKLWVANNNDSGTNAAPTLVRISTQLQSVILNTASTEANPNLTNSTSGYQVWNLPSSVTGRGQLGGMQIDTAIDRIYVNEQVSGSGMWLDIATLSNIANNFTTYQLPITSTNPGNGGIYLATSTQILNRKEVDSKSVTVSVYPNPSSGTFQIDSSLAIQKITVYDPIGKQIPLSITQDNKYSIQNSGIYFLQLEMENGTIITKKVIIP